MANPKGEERRDGKKYTSANPWVNDTGHVGVMSVRQLMGLVMTDEFPNGLDTLICIGDVEGNLGVNGTITVTAHRPGDVVLSIDPHGGDQDYDPDGQLS